MKKIFFILMGLTAIIALGSCSKDDDKSSSFNERDIIYIVNYGERQSIHISTEAELDSLLTSFCDHLSSGHGNNITFFDAIYANSNNASKETITFTTTDRAQLKAWMRQMEDDGKTVSVTYDAVSGIYSGMAYANRRVPTSGTDWVDLGLPSGVLWATCNVGASNPEDYGDYFAWAETTPKPEYTWANYHYCQEVNGAGTPKLTKYCKYSFYGYNNYSDTLTTLEPCDDAATAYLGDGARTPTYYEWKELMDNCTFVWTTENGVNGYRITGQNNNSIFLPGVGTRTAVDGFISNTHGCYWSSSLGLDFGCNINDLITYAWVFIYSETEINDSRCQRHMGLPIRAVRSAK